MFTVPTLTSGAKPIYTSGWFVEPNGATWRGEALESYGNAKVLVPGTGHAIVLLGNTAPKERWKPGEVAGEIDNAARLKPALPPFLCRSCRPPFRSERHHGRDAWMLSALALP